jgi:hypothetical protein
MCHSTSVTRLFVFLARRCGASSGKMVRDASAKESMRPKLLDQLCPGHWCCGATAFDDMSFFLCPSVVPRGFPALSL